MTLSLSRGRSPRPALRPRSATRSRLALSGVALSGLVLSGVALSGCRAADRNGTAARAAYGPPGPDSASVRRDVTYLASDALEGRGTGTAGNDSAAAYVARRFATLGLVPAVVTSDSTACAPTRSVARAHALGRSAAAAGRAERNGAAGCASYLQPFTARSAALAHAGRDPALRTQNVVALLPGTDPALRGQYVVIGAHFDHLGRSSESAQDPEARDAVRNGADDNASGTAAVLELARLLARHPVRRSVIFVTFSGEELGLLGSQYFVEHAPVPMDSVQAMLNFDMVGRLRDGKLLVYGVATSPELPKVLATANASGTPPLAITSFGDGFGPSDHSSFFAKNVPVLHFFTDLHDDYHRATDDAEKVNAAGAAQVIALAERVVRDLGDRPTRLPFQRAAQPVTAMRPRQGSNVYFGSVPDMGATDVQGLRLSGVTPGSPADQAGLQSGDIIVEFAGTPVNDLYEYSDALYAKKPGDVVQVVVLRGGQRVTLTATLGTRGR